MKLFLTILSLNMSNLGLEPEIVDWKISRVPVEDIWREGNIKGTMSMEGNRMDGNWTNYFRKEGYTENSKKCQPAPSRLIRQQKKT